jgi:hypothetical protein
MLLVDRVRDRRALRGSVAGVALVPLLTYVLYSFDDTLVPATKSSAQAAPVDAERVVSTIDVGQLRRPASAPRRSVVPQAGAQKLPGVVRM